MIDDPIDGAAALTQEFIRERISGRKRRLIDVKSLTRSAVLIPIVKTSAGLDLLFTKRTESVEHHKGQISFPGGAADPMDGSPAETALRESHEEIGLERSAVSVLGMMDDLQTPSGFVVTPVVGFIEHLPQLRLNSQEVAELVFLPLRRFFDDSVRHSKMMERNGITYEVYFYEVWKEPVWGATAYLIKQLIDALRG